MTNRTELFEKLFKKKKKHFNFESLGRSSEIVGTLDEFLSFS